jgi:cyanate permease
VNGILWLRFHAVFYPWTIIAGIPFCLIIPFIAQRSRTIRPGMVMHFLINTTGTLSVFVAVRRPSDVSSILLYL